MSRRKLFSALFFAAVFFAATLIHAQTLAPTPPMGWNSWDAYGLTIDEADFKANASVLAGIQRYGWQYAVIDEGWYMANPFGHNLEEKKYLWDENGLLIPVPDRFPSSADGQGFKPLADWVHAQGPQVRNSHRARNSARGGQGEPAHRRLELPCRRRGRH